MTFKRKNALWLYGIGNHDKIPLIPLCLKSLSKLGLRPTIIDRSFDVASISQHNEYSYLHIPLGRRPFRTRTLEFIWKTILYSLYVKPDIIFASLPLTGLLACLIASIKRIPFVYYPFEIYGEEYERLVKNKTPRLGILIEKFLLRFCIDAFITQNKHRANFYFRKRSLRLSPTIIQNYKPKINTLNNGLIRAKLNINIENRIVLYEGDILQQGRNLINIIKATRWFPARTVLVLMGQIGTYAKKIILPLIEDAPYKNKVFIMEWVSHENLFSTIADADIGLISYSNYGANNYYCAPGKVSDYINCGIPIVSPRFPSIESIITEYGIGYCFEDSSPQSIAKAVSKVLKRPRTEWEYSINRAKNVLVWETQEPIIKSLTMTLLNDR